MSLIQYQSALENALLDIQIGGSYSESLLMAHVSAVSVKSVC